LAKPTISKQYSACT